MKTFCIICNKQTWFEGSNEKYITTKHEGKNYYTCDTCKRDEACKQITRERILLKNENKLWPCPTKY